MRELITFVVCIAVGTTAAWIGFSSNTRGERNAFEPVKTIGLDREAAVAAQAQATASSEVPNVEVDGGPIYNFGSMDKGETRKHQFVIRNTGEAPLRLKLLDTSCKCTLSAFEQATVEPGESVEVELEWKSQDYLASFSQNARIQTNDPDLRTLELRVMGAVVVPIRPSPEYIAVGGFQVADGFEASVDVYGHKSETLEVISWTWDGGTLPEGMSIETVPIEADDPVRTGDSSILSGVRVVLRAAPGMPIGPLRGNLELSTDPPAPEPIVVVVTGSGAGPITIDTHRRVPYDAESNTIFLGQISQVQTKSVEITLVVRGESSALTEITIDPADIEPSSNLMATVLPKKSIGNSVQVPIRIDLDGAGGSVSRMGPDRENLGRITIRTNDPSTPVINLYVKFAVTL